MISPAQVPFESPGKERGFPCPVCGARLSYTNLHNKMGWIVSVLGSGVIFYFCGKRGWDLIALTPFGSLVLFPVFLFVVGFFPNTVKLEQLPPEPPVVSNRDLSLNLKDKPPR
jgi:hypothetical protein